MKGFMVQDKVESETIFSGGLRQFKVFLGKLFTKNNLLMDFLLFFFSLDGFMGGERQLLRSRIKLWGLIDAFYWILEQTLHYFLEKTLALPVVLFS